MRAWTESRIGKRRRNGRPVVTYWIRFREGAKVRRVHAGFSAAEAESRRREIERGLADGTFRALRYVTVGEFAAEHLRLLAGDAQPATVHSQRVVLDRLMAHVGSDRRMDRVTVEDVEGLLAGLAKPHGKRNRSATPATRRKYLRTFRGIFNRAMARGAMRSNPAALIQAPKVPDKRKRVLTLGEDGRLLAACGDSVWRKVAILGLYAGLRIGEITHLRWCDVDVESGAIRVECRPDWRTKTAENRTVYMPLQAVQALAQLRGDDEPTALIVRNRVGGVLRFGINRAWRRLVRLAGMAKCTPHDMRRTYLSRLPPEIAQKMAGHRSIKTTMDSYHETPDSAVRAAVSRIPVFELVAQAQAESTQNQPNVGVDGASESKDHSQGSGNKGVTTRALSSVG